MNKSKQLPLSSYHQQVSRILGRLQNSQKQSRKPVQVQERLSFTDIQNITKSMIKDKKVNPQNMGVITNIKGKMYCLKLGQVSKPKEFSYFFYSTQFKERVKNVHKPARML